MYVKTKLVAVQIFNDKLKYCNWTKISEATEQGYVWLFQ